MACRPIKNKEGQITGITAANGKRSELFDSLSNEKKLGPALAYQTYAELRLKKFTDWFGAKWDTPSTQSIQASEVDKISNLPFEERIPALIESGIMASDTTFNVGKRFPIIVNVNGVKVGFYRSSAGTDGKQKGAWTPMFGFGENLAGNTWLIKGNVKNQINVNYNSQAIKEVTDILNSTLNWDHSLDEGQVEDHPFYKVLKLANSTEDFNNELYGVKDLNIVNGKPGLSEFIDSKLSEINKAAQQASSQSSIFTDKNGEPKIISGDGKLEVMNLKGEIRPLSDFVKSSQGMDPKLELEILDIASDIVTDTLRRNDQFKAKSLLSPTIADGKVVDNGPLAMIMLTKSFPNLRTTDLSAQAIAFDIYNVYKNFGFARAKQDAAEQGLALANYGRIFFKMYDNWNDQVDSNGNVAVFGYRSKLRDRLEAHNIQFKEDTEELVEEDDTPIRIYGISRLQENPRNKLSAQAKSALAGIKYRDPNSILKAEVSMTVDKVYSLMTEAVVDSQDFNQMLAKLSYMAAYRPEVTPIVERLNSATDQQKAAIFANFSLAYKDFLMLKIERQIIPGPAEGEISVKTKTSMFNPNEGSIARRYRSRYKENSVERQAKNPRALYKQAEDGSIAPIESKIRDAETAIERMQTARNRAARNEVTAEMTDALAEYIWALGMEYGPTLDTTKNNLQQLFEKGTFVDNKLVNGRSLFETFINPTIDRTKKPISNLVNIAKKGINIYDEEGKTITRIADYAPLFDPQQVGAFISGTNKQYWPVNQATQLDEIALSLRSTDGTAMLEKMRQDPFYNPPGTYKNHSVLLAALADPEFRNNIFKVETLDSIKEPGKTNDYDSQSDRVSLILRLNAFANNANQKYTKLAVPTEADRGVLHFITQPRYDKLEVSREDIIKGLMVQDYIRKTQAEAQVSKAEETGDTSQLIEGYHFDKTPFDRRGNAFTLKMSQIDNLSDPEIIGPLRVSDLIEEYLSKDSQGNPVLKPEEMQILDNYFENQIEKVDRFLEKAEKDIKAKIADTKINLQQEVHSDMSTKTTFIKDFVFNDFVGRAEMVKLLRGGFTFAKNKADFYKRMALLTTPGQKLYLNNNTESDYGMMPTYNELTVEDFDFVDTELAKSVVVRQKANLKAAIKTDLKRDNVAEENAERIAEKISSEISESYLPATLSPKGEGLDKTDAQGFISIDMYRGIQMGLGSWTALDEQAYENEKAGLGYVDNNGNARPIYPIKPYHEELTLRNGTMTLTMNKNSYMTITNAIANEFPEFKKMHNAFEAGVHVINPKTATKGSKINVQDVLAVEELDVSNPMVMDSNKLRIPQIIPRKKSKTILMSRQVRKNSLANIKMNTVYENGMTGKKIFDTYHESISANIVEDTKKLENELGITKLRKQNPGTVEYAEAKYNYLQQVRKRIYEQVKDKQLSNNYVKALDIVPDGKFNWRFRAPLSFPSYERKFQQIFLSTFKNGIFNQRIRGKELVQIAEAGGHIVDSELKMYDGTDRAEVRIKASLLGLPADTNIEDVDPKLLEAIGYRVPHQGKNSSLPVKVVGFLPESHDKAIMVPGGVTKQMGSDFDVDKMYIIQPETEVVDGKLQIVKPNYSDKNPNRAQRDARIYDMLDTVLTSKEHLVEVLNPLDNPVLENLANKLRTTSTEYGINHPLVEIQMEKRNKTGQRQTGTWANFLAGHNVLTTQPLSVINSFEIDEFRYNEVGVIKDIEGRFIDQMMSIYLNAAVDAGKKPIHVDINDNFMTAPVSGLMLSMGARIEDAVHFVAQPGIKRAVEIAQNEEISIRKGVNKALAELRTVAKVKAARKGISSMESMQLQDDAQLNYKDLTEQQALQQIEYLNTFEILHKQGQELQNFNQLITPDTLENVNEMSSIVAYNENRREFLKNAAGFIDGTEAFLELNIYPTSTAYDSIRQTSLNAAAEAGFINNSVAFYTFKEELKLRLGKTKLTAAQHKFIDTALVLKIMASPESPLASYMSQEAFNAMYTNRLNNIGTRLERMQRQYPKLANNPFVQKLRPSKANHDVGQTIFTIDFDTTYETTSADKNMFTEGLLDLLRSPRKFANDPNSVDEVDDIKKFGRMLVSNQLLSSGFAPGPGAYIDLVPIEVFDTRIMTADQSDITPLEFFTQEQKSMNLMGYFEGFENDFVRQFGTASPGGAPLLQTQKLKSFNDTIVMSNKAIANDLGVPSYFVSYSPNGPVLYMLESSTENSSTYKKLQPLGQRNRVHEILSNRSNSESLVSSNLGVVEQPAIGATMKRYTDVANAIQEVPESIEQPTKLCKL